MDKNKRQQKLKQIYKYYESFLDLSNDAVLIFDKDKNIIDASNQFCSLCGVEREQIYSLKLDDLILGKDNNTSKQLNNLHKTVLKEKRINNFLVKFKVGDDVISFKINASVIDQNEKDTVIVSSWHDISDLVYYNEKASENKRKLKTLLDNLRGFAFRSKNDKYWTLEFVSAAFESLTGYSRKDVINNKNINYAELIIPDDRERVWNEVQIAIKNKIPYDLNYTITTKSGELRLVEEHGVGVFDDNDKLLAIEGYVNDITNKMNERKALQRSESINRSITQSAAVGVITFNSKGLINSWNIAAKNIFGFGEDEITGKEFTKIIPDLKNIIDAANNKPSKSKMLNNLVDKTIEIEGVNKKGQGLPIELSLSKWEFDNELFFTAIIRDITARKKNENKLRQLSTAVNQSPAVIVITDTKGKIEYANPKFTELTKYKLEEVIGENPRILKSGEQPKSFYKNMWETILAGKTWKGDVHNIKKTGETFWERVSISPIYDESGNIKNFIKIAEDITKQKHDLLKLQQSEESYRRLIETTSEGFWLINKQSKTIGVNKSLCKMLGYSKNEMLGKTPYDFVDDENYKIFQHQISISNNDKQRIYEIQLQKKDGKNIFALFSATTMLDHENNFDGSFAFVRDISEQKRSQLIQKILYNISKANTISDNLQTLISIIQKEVGKVVDTTNFYVALWNEKNDILSFPYYADQYDSFTTAKAEKTLTKYVIETKKPLLADIDQKRDLFEKGKLNYVGTRSKIWMGVPLKNEGEVFGVFAVQNYDDKEAYSKEDLSIMEIIADQISISIQRKQSEEALKRALAKATESDKLKSAFLQNISHEIRTPMNGLLGFTSLLKNSDLSGEEQQEFVDIIMESGGRLLNTLDDIMNISMIETGQITTITSDFNVNKELEQQFELHKDETTKKGLEFVINTDKSINEIILETDYDKFNSILSYLIINAIKYTFEGTIEVGFKIRNDHLEFYVKDSGIGIPSDRLEAIFDIFVQADLAEVKAKEGSGLGLSITKAYVEILGGKIWAESTEGKGSTFYFTIPYKSDDIQILMAEDAMTKDLNDLKILIVEDEDFSIEYLKIVLRKYASNFLQAKNGQEAIHIARENPDLDLIFMDIRMPIVNGYKATEEIRKFNTDVKIIAQSAYALQGDEDKALNIGCDAYLTKPIDKKELLETVETLIKT